MQKIKVLVISGPTGVGKTLLGALCAKQLDGELISCDSVQIYKELNIGSNKDRAVPQHMVDVVSWRNESFSAADFHDTCVQSIISVHRRGRVPLLVGGTGFYMKWLLHGRPSAPPPKPVVKDAVDAMCKELPWDDAIVLLEDVDPEYAKRLSKNDYYRLKRALSSYMQSGKTMSHFLPDKNHRISDEYELDFCCFYISKDRWALSRCIDKRCEEMLKSGLITEVASLWFSGFHGECPAGRSIGYSQCLHFLQVLWNEFGANASEYFTSDAPDQHLANFIEEFKGASRKYAKRQDCWFHKESMFKWVDWKFFQDTNSEAFSTFICDAFSSPEGPRQNLDFLHSESLKLRFSDSIKKKMRKYTSCNDTYGSPERRLPLLQQIEEMFAKNRQ